MAGRFRGRISQCLPAMRSPEREEGALAPNSLGGVVFRIGCYPRCKLGGLVDFKQKIAAFVIRALSNAPINFRVPRTKGVI